MEGQVMSRDQSRPGFADPGTVGAIVVGLAGRVAMPGLRLLNGALQLARGAVDATGSSAQVREVASARLTFHQTKRGRGG
jgi:hypothetical protein